MVTETETNYKGTNFVVITLLILLVLVGGYFLITGVSDVSDDPDSMTKQQVMQDATNPTATQ